MSVYISLIDNLEARSLLRFYRSRYPETVAWLESTFGVKFLTYTFNRTNNKVWKTY